MKKIRIATRASKGPEKVQVTFWTFTPLALSRQASWVVPLVESLILIPAVWHWKLSTAESPMERRVCC